MFTPEEREQIRQSVLHAAQADDRVTGGAITGSASVGKEDPCSDVDLAFGVRSDCDVREVLADYSSQMYERHEAKHHVDVLSGSWIYRVFLLENTLQVDLAFAPEKDFGAKGPTFKLLFGDAVDLPLAMHPDVEIMIGYAWLYALHVRSSIVRGKMWQAKYMIENMRDRVMSMACLRHGLPIPEGRGYDQLPSDLRRGLKPTIVRSLTRKELSRAFAVTMDVLLEEIQFVDSNLEARLSPILKEIAGT